MAVEPDGLKPRGHAVWAAGVDYYNLDGGSYALFEEACRIADRLDGLNRVLAGDHFEWIRLARGFEDDQDIYLTVDKALSEARQQAIVLRAILTALPIKEAGGDGDGPDLDSLGAPT